jgi:hypothetical protein
MPSRRKFSSKFNWVNERREGRFREVRQWVYRKVRPRGTLSMWSHFRIVMFED